MGVSKKNLLIETFSVLRDSWDSREDSICKILEKMAAEDSQKAVEMWEYLLHHNKEELQKYGSSLTHKIIYHLKQGMSESKLADLVFSNDALGKLVFKTVSSVNWNQIMLLYYLILKDDTEKMKKYLDFIMGNTSNSEYRVGRAAAEIISRYEEDGNRLSPKWVRFFMEYAETIRNPEDKAELVVAMIDYV